MEGVKDFLMDITYLNEIEDEIRKFLVRFNILQEKGKESNFKIN